MSAQDSESGFKYAALIFSPPSASSDSREMHGGKETFAGSVTSLIPSDEIERWREWLGSVRWKNLERAGRVVVARSAAPSPSVLDGDDRRLQGAVFAAWRAFLLTGGMADAGATAWIISGTSAGDQRASSLLTVRSAQELDRLVIPIYRGQSRRFLELKAETLGKYWGEHGRHDDSWFHSWVEVDGLLASTLPLPQILGYALLAHDSARTRKLLEFSIPEAVRAAEGVIALEKNMGAKKFKERALRLVPQLRTDEYVASDVETLLIDLYQTRSDCVHGKLPFEALQATGEAGQERAAQLAYVADVVAREALLVALRHSDKSIFSTREHLERAWASGVFPP